jgi:demethylmenaquinone methyltransferase/2-methoxy-6-polyprenyl-1,4-benzoquinol methylase
MEKIVPYKESVKDKKEQVAEMFDNISHRYDLLNRVLSFNIDVQWRKKLRKEVEKVLHNTILDVATGTADVALELSKLPEANILGIDISEGMMSYGRKKIAERKLQDRIFLEYGDATHLKYENESFDVVTVSFGVRNFDNLEAGLLEMKRILKKGGHLFILEFSTPNNKNIKFFTDMYYKTLLPTVGKLISKDKAAYSYLPESVEHFPYGQKFLEILNNCGYCNVSLKELTLGVCTLYKAKKA